MSKERRFLALFLTFSCACACLMLVWYEDWLSFWTVLLGAAYIYLDRFEKQSEDNNE